MKLINIYDIDLPRELIKIVYTYAKKKDRTYRTEHAKIINGLRFFTSKNRTFCLPLTGETVILYPKGRRQWFGWHTLCSVI